jgi:DNA polymerase III gamma/tau subunit
MSNSKQAMSTVVESFKFASEKIDQNLNELARRENLKVESEELKLLIRAAQNSVDQALSLTCGSIEKAIKNT